MEITLFDALKKFFVTDKLIFIIIIVLSFIVYPYAEKKIFNYKDVDYLLVRIDMNTDLSQFWNEMNQAPMRYLDNLQTITHREKKDRNSEINMLDCKGYVGPRKYEVDCWFWQKLTKENRSEIVNKYINYIREDYRNYLIKIINSRLDYLYRERKWILNYQDINHFNTSGDEYINNKQIDSVENLKLKIMKSEDFPSLLINHRMIYDQKNTLYNSILIFVLLCFINFCRVILFN